MIQFTVNGHLGSLQFGAIINRVHSHCYILNEYPSRAYCMAHGSLLNVKWRPESEGSLGKNGYMYMYG